MTISKTRHPGAANTEAATPPHRDRRKSKPSTLDTAMTSSPTRRRSSPREADAIVERNQPLNWDSVLCGPPGPPDWLIKPFIIRGKVVSLHSRPKAGKSILVLDLVLRALSGCHLDGSTAPPFAVLYLDHENDETDLHERLHDMGAQPHQLKNLIYLTFPELEPLNSKAGGTQLLALAQHYEADLVVLDTVSRFVDGSENDAATWLGLYNHSLAPLKKRGIATLRLDHTGRDETRGARGSSAKSGDIDANWSLTYDSEKRTRTLTRETARHRSGPDRLDFRIEDQPLRHRYVDTEVDQVQYLVQELDRRGVDPAASRSTARRELQASGVPCANVPLAAAVKLRKGRSEVLSATSSRSRETSP